MQLLRIEIKNYRNLDGLNATFNPDCNFIVGENNLGKSNLLNLLKALFTAKTFRVDDFADSSKPIEIVFRLALSTAEIGQFDDLFDIDDPTTISIRAVQENPEDYIKFAHVDSETFIPVSSIRNLNFIHYDSLRNPIAEITFDKGRGVGRFLKQIIAKYVATNGTNGDDYLDQTQIGSLVDSVNTTISRIKAFKDFGINAVAEDNVEDLLTKVLTLRDTSGNLLSNAGYGVQFLVLVTLSVLERLQAISQQRGEQGVNQDVETGWRSISLVLGLDEPEIHLHPYMQRSLIKYLNAIIAGKNADFSHLIKDLFGIDELHGQIIVATHSPNVLLNSYKQIIRFVQRSGSVTAICGENITLNASLHKHLQAQFPLIKEAFFSRCAIFVEGVTELGCFPAWAEKLDLPLDDLGICVIEVGGSGSVPRFVELASSFDIRCYGITDKDDNTDPPAAPNHVETHLRDFEAELVSILDTGDESMLRQIAIAYDANVETDLRPQDQLNKIALKHRLTPATGSIRLRDIPANETETLRLFYITWFTKNKTILLGMLIGDLLQAEQIPNVYKQLLTNAKALAESP